MFVLLGLVGGLSAGPIMSLPSSVLQPGTRAVGMGIFFTIFYLTIVLAPLVGGQLANQFGSIGVTFDMGAALLVICCFTLLLFERIAMRAQSRVVVQSKDISSSPV